MKKLVAILLSIGLLAALAACGSPAQSSSEAAGGTAGSGQEATPALSGHLVVMTNSSGGTFEAVEAVIEAFQAENPGVTVEFSSQGSDYEQLMKAKMAANDLPDVFATHGWSIDRYGEYLRPLNDQPWYGNIAPDILPVITAKNGDIYTLPLNFDKSGIVFNPSILAELNRDIPATWDAFLETCALAKDAGYTPIYIAGKETSKIAGILNTISPTFLVTNEAANHSEELIGGTFNWDDYAPVTDFIETLRDEGYFNVDYLTADPISIPEKLASGEVLFAIENNATMADAFALNPDATLGLMPVPTLASSDEPVLLGGEREAYGVWKDGDNVELALALLAFMAQDENIKAVATASGMPSSMATVKSDIGVLNEYYDEYTNLRIFMKFDRAYQPNGMWSTMKTVGSALLAGEIDGKKACEMMSDDYYKFLQQQE